MKKFTGALLAALLMGLGFVALGAPAQAAYPSPGVTVSVSDSNATSGQTITVTACADQSGSFSISLFGQTKTGQGKCFSASFTAPSVPSSTTFPGTITYTGPNGETTTRNFSVTVSPAGQGGGSASGGTTGPTSSGTSGSSGSTSALPNTGGPNMWLLPLGAVALVLGAGGVLAARRREVRADAR